MANFQVLDAYGSVITIQSSTFGGAERQIVGGNLAITGTPSVNAFITNVPSVNATIAPASVFVLNPVSVLAVTQSGLNITSVIASPSPTATVTSVTSSASNKTLLASNLARKGATIQNNSATSVLVKLGTTAGINDYTLLMQDTDYYEVPANYSGQVDAIASSTAGIIRVTEITS
jgi:hypothetical protein